jgi:F0F1-type ATP synthase membrane subunit b/b'
METVQAIFTQLGINASLLPQFIVVVVMFILAEFIFLGRLQDVLETREEKTVKLENAADETFEKVTKMSTDYKTKMDQASNEAMKISSEKKAKLSAQYSEQFKSAERDVTNFVEQSSTEFESQLTAQKGKLLSEVEGLSNSLVQKILQ